MKKIIFLLLISVASYGQAVFDEGIQLSGNGPTISTSKILSQDSNGYVNYINAITLPVSTPTQTILATKLTKVSTVTGNAQAYVKNAAGDQVMYEIAAPSFEFIYGAAPYGGVFDAYAYDKNTLSSDIRSVPSSFAVTNAIAAATIPDATATVKGKLKLAGDLGGTADLPTVPGLSGKANLSSANFTGPVTIQEAVNANNPVTKGYADNLVIGLLNDRGSYNASSNVFPTTGGSGVSGAIKKGDIWYVNTAGILAGNAVRIGDSFRSLADTPAQNASNWSLLSGNIGYVPENVNNKQNSLGADATNTKYPTVTAVNSGLASGLALKPNDVDVVHKTGSIPETITGLKTFSSAVVVDSGTGPRTVIGPGSFSLAPLPSISAVAGGLIALAATNDGLVVSASPLSTSRYVTLSTSSVTPSSNRIVNFPDKSGTFAMTSDIPVNPITGTGSTNFIPKFTAGGVLGNSQLINMSNLLEFRPNLLVGTDYFRLGTYAVNGLHGGYLKADYNYSNSLNTDLTLGVSNSGVPLDAIKILNSGNVGIGTTNPLNLGGAAKWLTIDGTGSYGGGFVSSVNGVQKGTYYFENGFAKVQGESGSGVKLVVNGSTEALTIQSNGNAAFSGTISTTGINLPLNNSGADAIFNSIPLSSSSTVYADNINTGFGTGDCFLESFRFQVVGYGMQRLTYTVPSLANRVFVRSVSAGTWTAWVEK